MSASLFVSNVPLRKPTTPPVQHNVSPDFLRTGDAKSESNGHLTEITVSWCNYCSQQANFRCVRCRDAFYCSVHCQTQDWTAHRHTCTASSPVSSVIKYPTESQGSAVMEKTVTTLQPKLNMSDDCTAQPTMSHQKTYLKDLKPNSITKGTEIKGLVAEFRSPSRFFVQSHDPQVTENLKSITTELTKAASDGPPSTSYTPNQGEVCAVKFALDGNWFRGLVQAVSANQKPATVLYIDIGNEETVADRLFLIKPLPVSLQVMPPCVLQCRLSGVVPVAGSWTRECCMVVKQLLSAKYLPVSVIDASENGHVFTVDIELSAFGKRLSTFLIDQGYAAPAKVTKKTEPDINSLVSASLDNYKRLSIGKDENLGARPPKPLTLCVGDTFSAMITNLQSPHNMICQKFENAAAIHEHQCMLREHCSQIPANQKFRPAPGTMCCSYFSEDKQWYRAKVLAYSSEEHVCVGYIDFGPSEEVELSRLRPISRALLALPLQAIPCALAGVGPVDECWSEDCIALLRQAVCNRQLRVKILGKRDGTALVSMMDEFGDPQADIAELLLTLGHAYPQQLDADSQTHNGDSLVEETWADTQFVSCAASPEVPPPIWCYAEFPSDGQMVAVVANLVENPGDFYCYLHNPEDPHKMQNLMADLKQHCEVDNAPFRPRVGEPCCAMFSGDGVWYRAMVQSVFEEKAEVLFVDYGNSSQVEIRHLRTITPQLLTLPIQAIHCCLAGMLPVGSAWSSETISRFQTLMGMSDLKVRVTSKVGDLYEVELESGGQSVTSTLQLEEHLATNAATRQDTENCSSSVSEAPETDVTRETSQDLVPPITKDAAPPLVPSITKDAARPLVPSITKDAARPLVPSITKDTAPPLVPPTTKDAAPPLVPPITKDTAPPLVPPITKDAARPLVPHITKDAAPPLVPPITKDAAPPIAVTLPPDVPAGCFPVDWRAGELPQNKTFQPRVAAIISPALFYLHTTKMGVEELQKMMMDLEVYGRTNQDFCLSQTPAVGAACCARSSGDKNWYRAVVLEAGESEVTVLYADHSSTETLPYTSILPIPSHLLMVPFCITRCTLSGYEGKELFPLPAEEFALFKTLLSEDVSAAVEYSDNLIHLLSVTLPAHRGGGKLNPFTLNRLQPQTKTPPRTDQALEPQHTDASASGASQMPSATPVELEQPTINTDATGTMPDAAVVNDDAAQKVAHQITAPHSPHTQSNGVEKQQEVCCCVEMKTKMAHLEQMLELLLTRMEK